MNHKINAMNAKASKSFMVLVLFTLVMMLIIGANLVYGLPWLDSLQFILAVFFLFYIPGNLLLSFSSMKSNINGSRSFVSLGIGTVVVPVIYLFFRRYFVPDLIIQSFFVLVFIVWCLYAIPKFLGGKVTFQLTGADLIAAFPLLILIVLLLHFSHFTDVRLLADGFQIRNNYLTETIFHQGVINALRDTWPPPALYASGGADFSSYHLNMHLQIELVQRFVSVNSLHLIFFYVPFLYFILLVALPYLFVRQIGGSLLLGIVAGALIFGSGFSYIPGILGVADPGLPWVWFFTSTIWSLFTLNGYIPALIALFLCIWFLSSYYRYPSKWTLFLITLLAYGAFGFKSSMGMQIAGTCLLIGIPMAIKQKSRRDGVSLSIASLLMLLIMFFDLAVLRSGVGDIVVAFAPFNIFSSSINRLGLSGVSDFLYVPLFMGFLIGTFGLSALGFLNLQKLTWSKGKTYWLVAFLAAFTVGGYLLSEMISLGETHGVNNAGWFLQQSLMSAWFLLFILLVQWEYQWKNTYVVILLILAFAMPSTIQFLSLRFDSNYISFDSHDLSIVDRLGSFEPGAVILHPINKEGPALASNFAGKPSVLNVYRSFVSEANGLTERATDVQEFFSAEATPTDRSAVLKKYSVSYVYCPVDLDSYLDELPELKKIQATPKWSLYQVEK